MEKSEKIDYPFFFQPKELAKLASKKLQNYLENQKDWQHNFGFDPNDTSLVIGKMFGVLVVENGLGELGYLAAYSGKLANSNQHSFFVPTVFDMLDENGFYKIGENELNKLNRQIEEFERSELYLKSQKEWQDIQNHLNGKIEFERDILKQKKKERQVVREEKKSILSDCEFELLLERFKNESITQQNQFKKLQQKCLNEIKSAELEYLEIHNQLIELKKVRKEKSNILQQQLFEKYSFLNANQERKSLKDIFIEELKIAPPAGAGECCAPKLFQYAFEQGLKPICMAEFWWGQSSKSEVRKHKEYYPACRSKCEPILGHMLIGLSVEPNPMLRNPAEGKEMKIVFEDDKIIVIDKPHEFLSVNGKLIDDSVESRIQKKYPEAKLVHRLDQSTSGLLICAKDLQSYVKLQKQFLSHRVMKKYYALLDGNIKDEKGEIHLPLRVDLDNRPHQMVCYEHGKDSWTDYEVVKKDNNKTWVIFYPKTGRTHQLRVHSAHADGLNAPILGDDLYGHPKDRLHLQAFFIGFFHPESNLWLEFELEKEF